MGADSMTMIESRVTERMITGETAVILPIQKKDTGFHSGLIPTARNLSLQGANCGRVNVCWQAPPLPRPQGGVTQQEAEMNKQIENFARQTLKDELAKLPEPHNNIFRRMYGKPEMSTNDVIDAMPAGNLDLAMQQVENTLKKISK